MRICTKTFKYTGYPRAVDDMGLFMRLTSVLLNLADLVVNYTAFRVNKGAKEGTKRKAFVLTIRTCSFFKEWFCRWV